MGTATPVPDRNDPYPNYMSSTAQELYGGGVAVPDPVRAASLSQQQLVAKQIQTTKEQARLVITTKRRRDEVDFSLSLAKRLRTEGKFFRTVASKTIESDQYGTPEHVDVAFSQSGNRFGFKTLVSNLGQGSNGYLATEKVMFTSNYHSRCMCTSCAEPHSIYNKDVLNIFLSDQHVLGVVPCHKGMCMIMCIYGNATLDILRRHIDAAH